MKTRTLDIPELSLERVSPLHVTPERGISPGFSKTEREREREYHVNYVQLHKVYLKGEALPVAQDPFLTPLQLLIKTCEAWKQEDPQGTAAGAQPAFATWVPGQQAERGAIWDTAGVPTDVCAPRHGGVVWEAENP